MFKSLLLFTLLLFSSLHFYAQGETNNWYFGDNAGITFNTNPPSALTDGELLSAEGCSSMSDAEGNLLFYTDGRTIWDANHQIMTNANYFTGTGLNGNPVSTQSSIIVQHPTELDIYFVFTVDEPTEYNANAYPNAGPADANGEPYSGYPYHDNNFSLISSQDDDGFNNGLNYSVVDMSLRNGLGDVVQNEKNNPLITYDENDSEEIKFKCSEKLTAVKADDCNSVWVITHFIDRFYAFLVNENGVDENPVISQTIPTLEIDFYADIARGYLKASPNGEKLLMANIGSELLYNVGSVYLYDFDNATGEVSNSTQLASNLTPYGVEFSPDSKKAYANVAIEPIPTDLNDIDQPSEIYQWDLESNSIPSSLFTIVTSESSDPRAGAMQLGPDGKIYISRVSGAILHVINSPNKYGADCDYSSLTPTGAVNLLGRRGYYGLPNFVQSNIIIPRVDIVSGNTASEEDSSFETEVYICDGETYTLGYEHDTSATYQWFENNEIIPGETSPYLEINLPPGEQAPFETTYTLEIFPESGACKLMGIANVFFVASPLVNDASLIQCLTDFENESAFFNFSNAQGDLIAPTGMEETKFEFEFFENEEALVNNNFIENITNYENTSNPQNILVKVIDTVTRCESIANLQLIVDDIAGTEEINLFECDTNLDGIQEFNLELATDETNLVPTDFYRTINDALQDQNPISNPSGFSITEAYFQTIYFRTEAEDECGILGILNLRVNNLPFPFEDQEVIYCIEDFPDTIAISPSLPQNLVNDYEYFWPATNDESFSIQINEAGTYQVLVTDTATGCESLQNIVVKNSGPADVQVNITDGGTTSNRIEILIDETNNLGDYEFALDDVFGNYQDSPIFSNLTAGFYEVYVRDKNGCGVKRIDIALIGVMPFFTPNNDGVNDAWNLVGLPARQNATVWVFDRFGKLLIEFNAQDFPGWDGTYNGKLMANNDYWYKVQLEDGRVLKGNFTLKR